LGFRFRVWGLGSGFGVSSFGCYNYNLGIRDYLGPWVLGLEFGVQGSGFRVQGSGFRVQGSGFRVQGVGIS
jgi:hypothetical protein